MELLVNVRRPLIEYDHLLTARLLLGGGFAHYCAWIPDLNGAPPPASEGPVAP